MKENQGACQKKEGKGRQLCLSQELTVVYPTFPYLIPLWGRKFCRLLTRKQKAKKKEGKRVLGTGEGRACSKVKEKEETETRHKCPEGQGAHLSTRLCCPFSPALNQFILLARHRQGWYCTGFGKNSIAAPQGTLLSPVPLHWGTVHLCMCMDS